MVFKKGGKPWNIGIGKPKQPRRLGGLGWAVKSAGSTRVDRNGRILVKVVNHPAFGTGFIKRAHLIWWSHHREICPPGFVIHHKDENKANDKIDNLEKMTESKHSSHHRKVGTPWNKGKKGVQKRPDQSKRNRERVWTDEARTRMATFAKARTDLTRDQFSRFKSKRS